MNIRHLIIRLQDLEQVHNYAKTGVDLQVNVDVAGEFHPVQAVVLHRVDDQCMVSLDGEYSPEDDNPKSAVRSTLTVGLVEAVSKGIFSLQEANTIRALVEFHQGTDTVPEEYEDVLAELIRPR